MSVDGAEVVDGEDEDPTQGWRIWCLQGWEFKAAALTPEFLRIPAESSSQALKNDRWITPEPASPGMQDLVSESFKKT